MGSKQELHVLRGILRLLKTPNLPAELLRKGPVPRMNPGRAFCLEQYRNQQANDANNDDDEEKERRKLLSSMAVNYHQLLTDLAERARLYELDTGAEVILSPKEMSRRAAARAGLQLPEQLDFDENSERPDQLR